MIGFIAEVGDIGRFTDPKQIQKLVGLEIVKKSSGKKKGQPRISKRGRRKLRRTMYESARALMNWNPAFQDVFLYYRNRTRNPLGGMQAKIAVACKAIRVFYVVLQTGCDFDEEKFRKDIIRPEMCCGGCRAVALNTTPDDYLGKDMVACEFFRGGWKKRVDELLNKLGVGA
ncbi:IS110 family transposase [Butyrivibrio sp. LC3010]|uniref:IS110 family transposase n=1 Tax=Butyrivibrio sp. LC3010 TaxID=1280680 RepID=UPI00041AA28F|nr:IS110 family transposase [Butyrivibrio sp. LC3010]